MSKVWQIVTIILVVIILIALGVGLGFSGVKNGEYDYVKIEINPKIEMLTDRHHNIVSIFPLNKEAKELIINEEFVGLKVEEGVKKFVDLCTLSNYIDVESDDNAIKLTVACGLTQSLEVKVYTEINKYLHQNEIKAVIVEQANDLEELKQAKKYGVCLCKFALMESVCNLYPDITMDEAKKLTEKEMLNKINTAFSSLQPEVNSYTEEELTNKVKLIDFNRAKINNHKQKINNKTQSKFADDYTAYVKENLKKFETNFNLEYKKWKENRINNSVA